MHSEIHLLRYVVRYVRRTLRRDVSRDAPVQIPVIAVDRIVESRVDSTRYRYYVTSFIIVNYHERIRK